MRTLLLVAAWLGVSSEALAKPEAPGIVCDALPEAALCMGRVPDCLLCHVSTAPVSWNAFGMAIQAALPREASFAEELPEVLRAIADADADGDTVSNLEELTKGTLPGDLASVPVQPGSAESGSNPDYEVGEHDVAYAYKRASVLYCGHSPSYEEMRPFRDAAASVETKRACCTSVSRLVSTANLGAAKG